MSNNYSGNEWKGAKFVAHRDIKEIAKDVRADIKRTFPELKTSVKIERYAGGQALNVKVVDSPEPLKNPAYDSDFRWAVRCGRITSWPTTDNIKLEYLTPRGKFVEEQLESIVNAYNRDDSDSMTDYFDRAFYEHVSLAC